MNELALFAGAGGGILGSHLLGWRTICAVERDAYAAQVLAQRQNDGILPPFPIWSDVTTFDGRPWNGIVDVISGGFPCQDISAAGKGAGITGSKSRLWKHMARIIREVRPRFAFVENSPVLTSRGLGTVLGDLAELGYDCRWGVIGASDIGAKHRRKRIWILADADSRRRKGGLNWGANEEIREESNIRPLRLCGIRNRQWAIEPSMGRVVNGLPRRMDRIKTLGNAQVPAVAASAFKLLSGIY